MTEIGNSLADSFLEHLPENTTNFYENYSFNEKPKKESVFMFLVIIECYSVRLAALSEKSSKLIKLSQMGYEISVLMLLRILEKQKALTIHKTKMNTIYHFFMDLLSGLQNIANDYRSEHAPGIEYSKMAEVLETQCEMVTEMSSINGLYVAKAIVSKAVAFVEMFSSLAEEYEIQL